MSAKLLCTNKKGLKIFEGSVWKDNDPRQERTVTAVGYNAVLERVEISCGGRVTRANPDRFGKRGGYSLVSIPD